MDEQELTPQVLGVLRSMELFEGKTPEELTAWLSGCPLRGFAAGERIIEEGTLGQCLYVLIRGAAAVFKGPERRRLAEFGPGSFFGEMTLISGLPRTATITTLEPCQAIEVPRQAFESWMKKPGAFRNVMDRTYLQRGLANHLQIIPEFAGIPPRVFQDLVTRARLRTFSKEEAIVREGDEADSLFLIRDGYVRLSKKMPGGQQRTLAYLNDGAYFGESSLLRSLRRDATVWAMGNVEAVEILKADFVELLKQDEGLLAWLVDRENRGRRVPQGKPGLVGEVVAKGLYKATSAIVIHLDACTRCGNCVKVCAELHDGISRLTRYGVRLETPQRPELVVTSCGHCPDPECLIGCPTGAILRDVNGEVQIQDSCIGCGKCAERCPYGNLALADAPVEAELAKQRTGAPLVGAYLKFWRNPGLEKPEAAAMITLPQRAVVRRIAVKCDLCQDYNRYHGCVHNCPYSAIERLEARGYG